MRRIFIDIEAIPPEEELRRRIHADIEHEKSSEDLLPVQVEKLADAKFRSLALAGEYGRVLVIGMIIDGPDKTIKRCLIGCDPKSKEFHLDEPRTLRRFWEILRDFNCDRDLIIGHNILAYDLLFLYKRSIIHQVRPTVKLSFARYRSRPIFDTMCEWERWNHQRISLGTLAEVLSLESSKSDGINGACVYDLFCAGRHHEIANYCARDVALTRSIYYRMEFLDPPI